MNLKEMFSIAGIDSTKGKAKRLVEQEIGGVVVVVDYNDESAPVYRITDVQSEDEYNTKMDNWTNTIGRQIPEIQYGDSLGNVISDEEWVVVSDDDEIDSLMQNNTLVNITWAQYIKHFGQYVREKIAAQTDDESSDLTSRYTNPTASDQAILKKLNAYNVKIRTILLSSVDVQNYVKLAANIARGKIGTNYKSVVQQIARIAAEVDALSNQYARDEETSELITTAIHNLTPLAHVVGEVPPTKSAQELLQLMGRS